MDFTFTTTASLVPAVIALLIIALGMLLWRKGVRGAAVVVFVIGGGFGFVFGPMLFMDRVSVDPSGVTQRTGFWFSPTHKGFQFDGIERVVITSGTDMKGRTIELWVAEYDGQPPVTVDPGDLWESNGPEIIDYIRAMGIAVDERTPLEGK